MASKKVKGANALLMIFRDEERQLSESLYRNLHVMQRFHAPTPEFLLVFEPYMFVKSNPKAFALVLHYIFNCLDPAEFNKRFRWPIFDKIHETCFRKTALEYMNHLNVTHQLGLETLKLSNIHIPGGLKFIRIIHKFTYLVMKVELNKPEHGPLPRDMKEIPDPNELIVKLEEYVERGMNFATRLQVQSDKLKKRIDEMNALMESCFGINLTNKETWCWACLGKEWRDELDRVVRDDVGPQLELVNVFSKRTVELDGLLTKLFVDEKENVVQYDKAGLVIAQNALKKIEPKFERIIDGIVESNSINFANLFKVFSLMLPNIMNTLETFTFRDLQAIEFEFNEIILLDTTASKQQDELNLLETLIEPFIRREEENFRKFCESQGENNLPFSLMQTPTITRRCQINRIRERFRLTDDLINKLFKEPSSVRPASGNTTMSKRSLSCTSLNKTKSQSAALSLLSKPKSRVNLTIHSSHHNLFVSGGGLSTFNTNFSSTMSTAKGTVFKRNLKFHHRLELHLRMLTWKIFRKLRQRCHRLVFRLYEKSLLAPFFV